MQTLSRRARAALLPSLAAVATTIALSAVAAPVTEAAPLPPSAWQQTAPPAARHGVPLVVTLHDGSGLVIGGSDTAVERFDPATGGWTMAAPLPATRTGASATVLDDGRVLVAGGNDFGGTYADAWLYDPDADSWTAADSLDQARTRHVATRLGDGTVLVAGGSAAGPVLSSAERYDPVTDRWTTVGALGTGRNNAMAVTMPDGSAVVLGGTSTGSLASVERFDPVTETWSPLTSLPLARAEGSAVVLPGGGLLALGGAQSMGVYAGFDLLSAAWGDWAPVAAAPRYIWPQATVLKSGVVLVVNDNESVVYDPVTGRVAPAGVLQTRRDSNSRMTVLGDGSVLVAGTGSNGAERVVERFTPRTYVRVQPADFGDQTTGRRGATVTIPVQTAGDMPLISRAASVEGAQAGDFAVVSDTCTGDVVPTRATCFVGVRFTPSADGPRSATLVLHANEAEGGRVEVPLNGVGVAAPVVQQQPPAEQPRATPRARAAVTPKLRCGARKGRRVVCTGAPKSLGSGRVRLSRSGIVHATGTLRNGKLTLTVRRRLFDRRYTLVVGGRRAVKVVLD